MASLWKYHKNSIGLILISCIAYFYAAYGLERSSFIALFNTYSIAFITFYLLYQQAKENTRLLAVTSIIFRVVFLFSLPNLSQDFYRFIWDGRMLIAGWNPYLYLPNDLIASGTTPIAEAQTLFEGMGSLSAGHYTNYPPVNQLCFAIAGFLSKESILGAVVVLRLLIILADIGVLYFGKKLLNAIGLPNKLIFLYLLNPFIIIELTGNLHFEGVMVFFLAWSMYLLYKGYWKWSAVILACSISVKLIPLVFLPLFFQWFIKRDTKEVSFQKRFLQLISYYAIVGVISIVLFLPFLSEAFIENYKATISLWFQKFEFNASLYYIARWIGYQIVGWNTIATIGKVTPSLVILFVMILTFFRDNTTFKKLFSAMLFGLFFYFITTTTVHPWYLTTLLFLTIFTKYRFPLVWTYTIILSYIAYQNSVFSENYWCIALEYGVVFFVLFWELNQSRKTIS